MCWDCAAGSGESSQSSVFSYQFGLEDGGVTRRSNSLLRSVDGRLFLLWHAVPALLLYLEVLARLRSLMYIKCRKYTNDRYPHS